MNCTSENVATSYINLLKEVAIAANEAIGVEAALRLALRSICRATGWPVGHALKIQSGGSLGSTGIWHVDEQFPIDNFTAFQQASEAVCFSSGIGLPGRVLAEGLPLGMCDASTDANFLRRRTALQADLRAGFALPVRSGNSITAVLEFFAPISRQPSPELLDVMEQIGVQLGRVFERHAAQSALQANEHRSRQIIDSAGDGSSPWMPVESSPTGTRPPKPSLAGLRPKQSDRQSQTP